jgi:hypothetical protein
LLHDFVAVRPHPKLAAGDHFQHRPLGLARVQARVQAHPAFDVQVQVQ